MDVQKEMEFRHWLKKALGMVNAKARYGMLDVSEVVHGTTAYQTFQEFYKSGCDPEDAAYRYAKYIDDKSYTDRFGK